MATVLDLLPADYGYVILVAVSFLFVLTWMAINVGNARKEHNVPYPQLYHSEPKHIFNCIQRAHQNTLESSSLILFVLLVGGLEFPRLCAGLGAVYTISRIVYAKGYYTGDPKKRNRGDFGVPPMLIILAITVYVGLKMLGFNPF